MKVLSLFFCLLSWGAFAQDARNVSEYNLNSAGVGLIHHTNGKFYDPVFYFPEGGSKPLEGKSEFSILYKGVTYHFGTENNMRKFSKDPAKFEPTYGGWCARAMVVGQKIGINPAYYTISGRRLHFFANKRAKRFFDRDVKKLEKQADGLWKRISGESPRL